MNPPRWLAVGGDAVRCSAWLGGVIVLMVLLWRARKWSLPKLVTASLVVNVLTVCCLLERARRERGAIPPPLENRLQQPRPTTQSNSPVRPAGWNGRAARDDVARSAQRFVETAPSRQTGRPVSRGPTECGGCAPESGRTCGENLDSVRAAARPVKMTQGSRRKVAQVNHQPRLSLCLNMMP